MDIKNMKFLTRDIIPCWYDMAWIGWNGENPAILFRLHKDFIRSIEPMSENAPIVQDFKQEFFNTLFDSFVGEFGQKSFGFNQAFKFQGEKEEFLEYLVPIPKINKPTGMTCRECDSTGRNLMFDDDSKCLNCNGTGKEYEIDWKTAYSISATFTLFTNISQYPETETSCSLPQLLIFFTITKQDMHGGSLGGDYSIPLVKYLISLGQGANITPMVYAMKASYQRMMGKRDYDEHSFRASVDYGNGWLNVDCPGDACGLHPADSSDDWSRNERGYKFACHNVDSPIQQLTLIAGLAALYEKARRNIVLSGSG